MQKIAIVGTSLTHRMTDNEQRDVRQLIAVILQSEYPCTLISGGAKGIDSLAEEIAKGLDIPVKIYKPKSETWDYYRERNLKIANDCDKLFCITTKRILTTRCYHCNADHQKTAGCWTKQEATKKNKYTRLMLIDRDFL